MEFSKVFCFCTHFCTHYLKVFFKKLLPVISPDDATELPLDLCVFIVSLLQLVYSPKTDVFPVELCNVDVSK